MKFPKMMNQVTIRESGDPDVLVADTGKVPEVGAGEVLIKVEAAGINRPDVMQRPCFLNLVMSKAEHFTTLDIGHKSLLRYLLEYINQVNIQIF